MVVGPTSSPRHFDLIIVGAGLVGLSTAYQILRSIPDLSICVLDKESAVAAHQSGHNSGVLHTGVYYSPGSLKAQMCQAGRRELVEFCRQEDIAHQMCGKVIVAVDETELDGLERIEARAAMNGVAAERIDRAVLHDIEPHVSAVAALYVRDAGVVDYRAVAARLVERIEGYGATVALGAAVVDLYELRRRLHVATTTDTLTTDFLICCGGLQSDRLARLGGAPVDVQIVPFRGEYHRLDAQASDWVRHLVYPVPNPNFPFLGVHLTRDIHGWVECGPNAVLNGGRECYEKGSIDPSDLVETLSYPGFHRLARNHLRTGFSEVMRSVSKKRFAQSVARLVPKISAAHLRPHTAGIRAQAVGRDGKLIDDFLFAETERSLHVINAPSPAATSSLAIGRYLRDRYRSRSS